MKEESFEKPTPLRFIERPQRWKEHHALKSLEDGKVSFLKAAEMAGLSVWDFADLVRGKEVIWIKSKKFVSSDIKKALRSTTD